jgi:hypothetical protein
MPAPAEAPPIPELKPKPAISAKTASEARGAAVSSWVNGLGTVTEEPLAPAPAPSAKEPPPPPTPAPAAAEPPDTPEPFPKTSTNWKAFVAARDEGYKKRDSQIKELADKLLETQTKLSTASPIDPKEFESIKSEREKLSETLRLVAVEKHPRFQAYYDNKTNAQIDLAKRITGPDKAETIAVLLKTPDSEFRARQIEDLMTDMSPLQQSRLGGVLNAIEDIRTERDTEITRAREDYDKVASKQKADSESHQAAARANAQGLFDTTLKAFQDPKDGLAVFQLRNGDESWNKSVQERIVTAKNILFGNEKPDALIKAAFNAASVPALLENQMALLTQISTLQSQIKQLQTAQPGLAGRGAAPASDGQPSSTTLKPGSRPMSVVGEWMKNLQSTQE